MEKLSINTSMPESQKRPRGRPRKYDKDLIDQVIRMKDCTRRSAASNLLMSHCMYLISEKCPEATQRFFLGGKTNAERLKGEPKLFRQRSLVMQELGRFSEDEIPGLANIIASDNGLQYSKMTQAEIVKTLKHYRLKRNQK
jgi:hypothetical protein